MLKKILSLSAAILLVFAASFARAVVVPDLYSGRVPVADQSPAALASGAGGALAQVLVKASGSYAVLEYPGIRAALKDARGSVQQYAFERDEDDGLWARYEFDASFVTELVTDSGAPLWTANRPEVLVWAVVESPDGRQFVSRENPEQMQKLSLAFGARGVPLQVPLYDLVDAQVVSPEDAWRLDATKLKSGSARYNLEHFCGARVAALSEGSVTGDWVYFNGEGRISRSLSAPSLEEFFQQGAALVAEDMASRYAVAASTASGQGMPMLVSGVSSYGDYAGVVRWLESIELIDSARVARVVGDRLELHLQAKVDAAQLAALIELNQRLQRVPSNDPALVLNYQWQE